MSRLTSRSLASGASLNDLIHIVITGDTSQSAQGSSYKSIWLSPALAKGSAITTQSRAP